MSLLVPLTTDHIALAFNRWCDVHASASKPFDVADDIRDAVGHVTIRTVCGSDVYPYVVNVDTNGTVRQMLMSWPPPPRMRCQDCQRITGAPTRPTARIGWSMWERLTDT